jgi:hypothetical protein
MLSLGAAVTPSASFRLHGSCDRRHAPTSAPPLHMTNVSSSGQEVQQLQVASIPRIVVRQEVVLIIFASVEGDRPTVQSTDGHPRRPAHAKRATLRTLTTIESTVTLCIRVRQIHQVTALYFATVAQMLRAARCDQLNDSSRSNALRRASPHAPGAVHCQVHTPPRCLYTRLFPSSHAV